MTEISFHFNAPDKLAHACRLLRKASNAGHQVVVVGADATLRQLDTALWTFSALDFVPHCFADASPAARKHSSIVLGRTKAAAAASDRTEGEDASGQPARQMLVNLDEPVPAGFERYERVIELVGTLEADRQAARARWKHYASRGYAMVQHDVSGAGASA
jgi:DNA polymerase-3 subunit chi